METKEVLIEKVQSRLDPYRLTPGVNGRPTYILDSYTGSCDGYIKSLIGSYIHGYWKLDSYCLDNKVIVIKLISYNGEESCYITSYDLDNYLRDGIIIKEMDTPDYRLRQEEIRNLGDQLLAETELSYLRKYIKLHTIDIPKVTTGCKWISAVGCDMLDRYIIVCVREKNTRLTPSNEKKSTQQVYLLCLDCGKVISLPISKSRSLYKSGQADHPYGCPCRSHRFKQLKEKYLNQRLGRQGQYIITDMKLFENNSSDKHSQYKFKCECKRCKQYTYLTEAEIESGEFEQFCYCDTYYSEVASSLDLDYKPSKVEIEEGGMYNAWKIEKIMGQDAECKCLHCGNMKTIPLEVLESNKLEPYSCGCVDGRPGVVDCIVKYVRKLNRIEGKGIEVSAEPDGSVDNIYIGRKINTRFVYIKIHLIPGVTKLDLSVQREYYLFESQIQREVDEQIVKAGRISVVPRKRTYLEVVQEKIHNILQLNNFTQKNKVQYLEEDDWRNKTSNS